MIDWSARVDDLAHYLSSDHQMEDRTALSVLLASVASCPAPGLWLILETNWFMRECQGAWFAFGGEWNPESLAAIRARRPWRQSQARLTEWVEDPTATRLLVEPDMDRYAVYQRLPEMFFVLAKCLRVRVVTGRSLKSLAIEDQERHEEELAARVRAVTEDRTHARPERVRFQMPPNFQYHAELLQRLSPWYRDWKQLTTALSVLAVRHAWLYGRSETTEEDYQAMARVASDSVPPWIRRALEHLLPLAPGGSKNASVLPAMRMLPEHWSSRMPSQELRRLRQNGILEWNPRHMIWSMVPEHVPALADILAGQAFQAPRTAAAS